MLNYLQEKRMGYPNSPRRQFGGFISCTKPHTRGRESFIIYLPNRFRKRLPTLCSSPADGLLFWSANEYATSSGLPNWGTSIAHFELAQVLFTGNGDFNGDKKTALIQFL